MDVPRFRLVYALYSICVFCANGGFGEDSQKYLYFYDDIKLGAASSAAQIEGAWNVSGKAESIWDNFSHRIPSPISDNSTGDVACEAYYRSKSDVALMKKINYTCYRFSISWPRLLPNADLSKINKDALRYYHELVDELLANDIEPIVTLYHWDHHQFLEDAGGWLNYVMVELYANYTGFVFKEFGHKVKTFITLNEVNLFSLTAYELGTDAPAKTDLPGVGAYDCLHHLLMAHAMAYRMYEKEYKPKYKGIVGINIQIQMIYPKTPNESAAADRALQFLPGWALHPVFVGDYPQVMKEMIGNKSKEQGFAKSRLPEFSPEWIDYIRGSSDFLAVNYYTCRLAQYHRGGSEPSFFNDWDLLITNNSTLENTTAAWDKVCPNGFGDALRFLWKNYGAPKIFITENGIATGPELDDTDRIDFMYGHLKQLLEARNRDKVDVFGYMHWSFMDSFEFSNGYRTPFGMVRVDHDDPEKKRTLKASADYMKRVIKAARNHEALPKE